MFLYLAAFLPALAFLLILIMLDSFALVNKSRLFLCLAMGIASCVAAFLLAQTDTMPETSFPLLEELLKSACLAWMIKERRMVFLAEALCYGGTVGAGFALAENNAYLIYNPGMPLLDTALRGIGTALMHMGCTALFACIFLVAIAPRTDHSLSSSYARLKREDITKDLMAAVTYLVSVAVAVCIHYAYNLFLLPPFIQIVATVAFFLITFVGISLYNERRIYRWLDSSITYDVQLLAAIKAGTLADTPTGRYLLSIKSQFRPEVFFDIICFMQLYLELTIQGKSRMLLEQEGLAEPLTAAQRERHDGMLTELRTLRRNIGRMGEYVLRPILRFDIEDTKVM